MPLAAELELPQLDHTDPELRGDRYRRGHGRRWTVTTAGWPATRSGTPFWSGRPAEFFLRTRAAVFPGLTIADLFGITEGPLYEEIVRNIINVNGSDHSRLRKLVNPALSPRAVERYRPAMRGSWRSCPDAQGRLELDFVPTWPSPTRRW